MEKPAAETKILLPLVVLSIAQLIGIGAVNFVPAVSREMAADFQVNISTIFVGTTVFYVAMGACAPFLSRLFTSYGARRVMIGGTIVSAVGLVLLSFSHSPVTYFLAWSILGAAGSASLTTPANILLNEIAGRKAARAIATLMLATGLYGTVFWPLTSFLSEEVGWRGTCEVYAATLALISLPLYLFGLPNNGKRGAETNAPDARSFRVHGKIFYLVVGAIALNAFITYGFAAIFIELLKAEGLNDTQALAFGSTLGVLQIGARGLNIIGGKRWDGLTMAVVSSVVLCLSLIVLLASHGSILAIGAFLALYGLSSGALAVARSTIPLVFYDKAEFAKALSRISLPLNWMSAISPPLLISVMTNFGSSGVLLVSFICSCGAIGVLFLLMTYRPSEEAISAP